MRIMLMAALVVVVLGCCAVLAVSFLIGGEHLNVFGPPMIAFRIFPAVILLLSVFMFWKSTGIQLAYILCLGAVPVSAYGYEILLRFTDDHAGTYWDKQEALGIPVDRRGNVEALLDMRRAGQVVYPAHIFQLAELMTGKPLAIFNTVSNSRIIFCNEAGRVVEFQSDERGYNNPAGLWHEELEIVAIGDSFTAGVCAERKDTIVGWIRRSWPATLNLGVSGAGPLMQFAIFKEYALQLKPKVLLWFFYENDLRDLTERRGNSALTDYLTNDSHSNRWIERQSEFDKTLKEVVDSGVTSGVFDYIVKSRSKVSLLVLGRLRHSLGISLRAQIPTFNPERAIAEFLDIFSKVRQESRRRGIKPVFVFLPSYQRVHGLTLPPPPIAASKEILAGLRRKGTNIIDVTPALTALLETGKDVFLYPDSHYSLPANQVVAETVVKFLRQQTNTLGISPPSTH